jgi:hypothetical protein
MIGYDEVTYYYGYKGIADTNGENHTFFVAFSRSSMKEL